ncbi:Trafficking protein particle complex subunit 2-like protein [Merluccius polli]|uniref:Trafficking protein particle complex subunit 2-like protein n=1 Tax=Merluccius polli TaxID=89951 RepID=A0AA47P6G8_MERPO|nr:Trafficking protein particle complex subunit 2-like protein [Merluccius polli]
MEKRKENGGEEWNEKEERRRRKRRKRRRAKVAVWGPEPLVKAVLQGQEAGQKDLITGDPAHYLLGSTRGHVTASDRQEDNMAVCIAVIAKENYPLYIRSVPMQNELKFHYTVHTSLDVVEEKISAAGKAMADQRELYLGLLYPTEDYKVYGYVTNSKVKFVIVVDSSNTSLRDNEIRSMFRKLHNSFTDVMCNPFYNPGDPVQSKAFDSMVSGMMVQAS